MEKVYKLRFWFEHGGICLWGMNDNAKKSYGYAISNNSLPISEKLMGELNELEEEYGGFLNWDDPMAPSPWTAQQKEAFLKRSYEAYEELIKELGSEFEILYEVRDSVGQK